MLRTQFPLLSRMVDGQPLVYLDNAATTHKPERVLWRVDRYYREQNANINRGMHLLGEEATLAYASARQSVAHFINAKHPHEVIFTRNATESINLVARSWGEHTLKSGDVVALSLLEHHSNIIPWMQLRDRIGIELEWTMLDSDGRLDLDSLKKILKKGKTKLVSITGLSNVLGIATPLKKIITAAHACGAFVLVDAAQLIAHATIDVQALDADFLAFSGHKIYGPTGIGVLYGKEKLLNAMPPFLGGGDMLTTVSKESFEPAELPRKFEAGTPSIADAIGLAEAIAWMKEIGTESMHDYTKKLIAYAREKLQDIDGLTLLGPTRGDDLPGCVSFTLSSVHPHDLTDILGRKGICLRAGHHCAQPLHRHLGIPASTRLSVAVYNTEGEIDACIEAIEKARLKLC